MADNPVRFGGGMFGRGIIPGMSQDDYLQQLHQVRMRQAQVDADPRGAGHGLFAKAGAALGNQLGLGTAQLPERDQSLFQIQDEGNRRFTERLAQLSEEERMATPAFTKTQMQLFDMAQAAADQGNMAVYTQLLDEMQRRQDEKNLLEAQMAKAQGTPPKPEDVPGTLEYNRKVLRELWSPTQRQQMGDAFRATEQQITAVNGILDLIEEVDEQGTNADILSAWTGEPITFANKLKTVLEVAVGAGRGWARQGEDDATREDINDAFERNFGNSIPDTIKTAAERARYKSLMIQMAYAAWRTMEGSGSRQASNQDIVMALDSIGANGGDMNSVLQTILQNTRTNVTSRLEHMNDVAAAAIANRVDPEYVENTLYGGNADNLQSSLQRTINRADQFMATERAGLESTELSDQAEFVFNPATGRIEPVE